MLVMFFTGSTIIALLLYLYFNRSYGMSVPRWWEIIQLNLCRLCWLLHIKGKYIQIHCGYFCSFFVENSCHYCSYTFCCHHLGSLVVFIRHSFDSYQGKYWMFPLFCLGFFNILCCYLCPSGKRVIANLLLLCTFNGSK